MHACCASMSSVGQRLRSNVALTTHQVVRRALSTTCRFGIPLIHTLAAVSTLHAFFKSPLAASHSLA